MLHGMVPVEWLPDSATALGGPAWSVSLEWQFYLVAPFLIAMVARKLVLPILALLALFLIFRSGIVSFAGQTFGFDEGAFLPVRILYFLAGIASYRLLADFEERRADYLSAAIVLAAIVLAPSQFYPFALWIVVMLAMAGVTIFDRVLSAPIMRYLGKISYSIYLTHAFVLLLVKYAFVMNHFEGGTIAFFIALTVPATIGTIALSHVTHSFVEQPFMNYGKYGTLTRPATAAQTS